MPVLAVGDVQGCYRELRALLDQAGFDESRDQLWLTGDLVNRGPDSLEVLRFVRGLGDRAHCVLGNHDLHLLAVACGARRRNSSDTFDNVLAAPDAADLLDWLRTRPLLHHDADSGWTMVHAGLPPQWDLETASSCARDLEARLSADDYAELLRDLFGNEPDLWSQSLGGIERLRFTTNCLTRLRFCDAEGRLALKEKGPPGAADRHLYPWFLAHDRKSRTMRIVFGHWSTLPPLADSSLLALDGGCVWGGQLRGAWLGNTPGLVTLPCHAHQVPGTIRSDKNEELCDDAD